MPHVTIEYSASLDAQVDMKDFCRVVKNQMLASGLFELGAIRVRAVCCDAFAIADEAPENAFIDVSIRVGAGRSLDDKKYLGEGLIAAMTSQLIKQFATENFALSLEIREIDADLSWKKNTIHARLRGK